MQLFKLQSGSGASPERCAYAACSELADWFLFLPHYQTVVVPWETCLPASVPLVAIKRGSIPRSVLLWGPALSPDTLSFSCFLTERKERLKLETSAETYSTFETAQR